MTIPTFDPGVNPSFALPVRHEWPVQKWSATKPYDTVIPLSVQPVRQIRVFYPALTALQREYILSFMRGLLGPAGVFYWTPPDPVESPLDAGPVLDQAAGGALSQRTYYVKYAWYSSTLQQETLPSPAASVTVAANYLLTVAVPYMPNAVREWRVYAHETSGDECLQYTVSNVRTWTEPDTGLVTLTATPVAVNTLKPVCKWRIAEMYEPEKIRSNRWSLDLTFSEVWT